MKASLPIEMIVIIVLAVIVLAAIIALFTGVWSPGAGGVNLEAVKSTACQKLVSMGCKEPKDIQITNFDADKDGTAGGTDAGSTVTTACGGAGANDNLLMLCKCYYNSTADPVWCRKLCGCQ